jgi:hypothetical protein
MSLFHRSFVRSITRRARLAIEQLEERTVPTLLGQQLFPADNPWNQQITNAPVAANSAGIMNSIITTYGDGRLHPDFGQDYQTSNDLYGIPYNVVHGNSVAKVNVVIDAYPGESDLQAVPLPSNVVIEGDYQNGPKAGVDNRGDSHLLVYDVDNNVAYEFYRASRPGENTDGKWHADQETVWDMKQNTFRTLGWTSADAAGLSILAGLVRPDEALPTSQGGEGVINHAIRFTLQNSVILDQFLYPASHVANSNSNAAVQPPMGARFRLKASVDLSQLDPESRVIAQAMKDDGLIVADNGSNFYFSGASYAVDGNNRIALTYDDNDIQDTVHGLKSLHFSDFEVVDLTPAVTGLSLQGGPAGTSVTVVGRNFSGAAGNLQVFFGNTAAASVTVLDDNHVLAVAPPGTGTVDVRVQSGRTTAADSENVENTIFGYGVSAVTTADRFTFGSTPIPPTAPPPGGPPSVPPSVTPPAGGLPFNFDKLGAYRPGDGSWSLDSDGIFGFNAATDQTFFAFSPPGVTGVAGDWTGTGRDNIGDFSGGVWHLDLNGNGVLDPGETFTFGQAGDKPIVGDWTGDGKSKLGIFRAAPDGITGEFILDVANHKAMDSSNLVFTFGLKTDRIVVGDWTGDHVAKIGVFRDATAFGAPGAAVFTLDTNNNHAFEAGTDAVFVFGMITDGLVVGDWNGSGTDKVGVYRDGSAGFSAPGVALFSLDTNGNLAFDPGVDAVFLYGFTSDQFVGGNWKPTPPLLPSSPAQALLPDTSSATLVQPTFAAAVAAGGGSADSAAAPISGATLGASQVGLADLSAPPTGDSGKGSDAGADVLADGL